ncbi:LexA family transcriptional regulator [Xenophilus sp. Marseille-Q4582]|uniref:LexA family transcriptional regulator n=1 Tax=Xenophilus sp. Marseille-Q4582 TaxID=2866600 RepID=UPI001CE418BA|nr:LexA family transcriptional regulator [Xenophilus sp. Marseille-Q4582]
MSLTLLLPDGTPDWSSLAGRLRWAMDKANKTNQSALAREIGVKPQAIQHLIDVAKAATGSKHVAALASALRVNSVWLATGEGTPDAIDTAPPAPDDLTEVAPPPIQVRRIPIVGTAKMGDDGFYEEISDIPGAGDGHIEIATADPNAYGLRCRGMSMFPAVRDGWYVVVEPNRRPTEGEYVLIKLRDGRKMLKELLFERPGSFEVMSVNEAKRFTVEKADLDSIQAVGPIVPPSAWRPV